MSESYFRVWTGNRFPHYPETNKFIVRVIHSSDAAAHAQYTRYINNTHRAP